MIKANEKLVCNAVSKSMSCADNKDDKRLDPSQSAQGNVKISFSHKFGTWAKHKSAIQKFYKN